jgi:transcriptional regulator GlxA family with amidase domain
MPDRPPIHLVVRRAKEVIEDSYADLDGPEDIAAAVGLPLETLRKAFRRETGMAPREYLERVRVAEAKRLLAETDLRAYEVGLAVGWDREDSASRAFHRAAGTTMREYRLRIQSN